jgi:beta-1,4-mannosyltransferase
MPEQRKRIRVSVLVLGDLGHSMRMQYHALALAADLADVELIGFAGTAPYRAILEHPHIRCHFLRPPRFQQRHRLPGFLFLGYTLLRVVNLWVQSFWILFFVVSKPDFVLAQNPPAIPTLMVSLLVARLRSAKLVVDWHNYSSSVLSLQLGVCHPAVKFTRWCERVLGARADAHFCVSRAMQSDLAENWGIQGATVLYDQPAEVFGPTSLDHQHALFSRLQSGGLVPGPTGETYPGPEASSNDRNIEETLVTSLSNRKGLCLRPDRPALIMSPTSWTADEDFDVLLEALSLVNEAIDRHDEHSPHHPFPRLLFLITGEGPLRDEFERKIHGFRSRKLQICTLWVSAEDYGLLLGSTDLGLCLHRSASGLDLPMKVADMFGCGLPVCAADYGPCLTEQVQHGVNGLVFSSAMELAQQLYDLFKGFPDETPLLCRLGRNVKLTARVRWTANWQEHARAIFANP